MATPAPFPRSNKLFLDADRSGFRSDPETGATGAGPPGSPVPTATAYPMLVSSLTTLGASLGLTKVVEDRIAASLRSSYRLGG